MRNDLMVAGVAIAAALCGCGGSAQSSASSSAGGTLNSSVARSDASGADAGGGTVIAPAHTGGSTGVFDSTSNSGLGGYSGGGSSIGNVVSAGATSLAVAGGGSSSPDTLAAAGAMTAQGGLPATGGAKLTNPSSATGGTNTTTRSATTSAGAGTSSVGGAQGSAGTANTGCNDTAQLKASITGAYYTNALEVPVIGTEKSYFVFPNWLGKFTSQSLDIDGIGFTISDPEQTAMDPALPNPAGTPSIFIGQMMTRKSSNSNLPKQLSALSAIWTSMSTNALAKDTSHFNAKYMMTLATSDDPLDSTAAFLNVTAYVEIWLFKPSQHRPRGALKYPEHLVAGVAGNWNVWINTDSPLEITYVSTVPLDSLNADLNAFLKDAVKNDYGPLSRHYLHIVEAGFDVWANGDGLQLKQFCAQVK
jgi:hypothetical protein